jgi:hypothetical protein
MVDSDHNNRHFICMYVYWVICKVYGMQGNSLCLCDYVYCARPLYYSSSTLTVEPNPCPHIILKCHFLSFWKFFSWIHALGIELAVSSSFLTPPTLFPLTLISSALTSCRIHFGNGEVKEQRFDLLLIFYLWHRYSKNLLLVT